MLNTKARTTPSPFTLCVQCGDALVAPVLSEHVNERCVRHVWSGETCGCEFYTAVRLLGATVSISSVGAGAIGVPR